MFPHWALVPVVALATVATIIASQAVISGAYSLTRQAIQLGFMPRMEIRHTSEEQTGQIFIPLINTLLLAGVLLLVILFRKSEALATAYGIAVTGTMIVTSILTFDFLRTRWNWSLRLTLAVLVPLVAIETIFLMANLTKFFQGGYLPVMVAGALFLAMWTWTRGTAILFSKTRKSNVMMREFAERIERPSDHGPTIVPGTAIFFTSDPETAPAALLHNLKHNRVLHEQNIMLTVKTASVPVVAFLGTLCDRAHLGTVPATRTLVRIHGKPERVAGADHLPEGRAEVRHHVDIVLSRPAQADRGSEVGPAEVAGPPLHRARQLGRRSDRLFRTAGEPGRRTRLARLHLNEPRRARYASGRPRRSRGRARHWRARHSAQWWSAHGSRRRR